MLNLKHSLPSLSKLRLKKLEDGTTISTVTSILKSSNSVFNSCLSNKFKWQEVKKKELMVESYRYQTHPKPHFLDKMLFNFWIYFSITLHIIPVHLFLDLSALDNSC